MNDQPEPLDLRSHDLTADKRAELLRLFPEVRTEGGQIDFDRLRLALGEMVDVGKERYGLTWPGKADCFRAIQTPTLATLRPCPEESVNFDTTEHLIIEGDNLEVLKLLQKSYLGKVKMIYIDPPYNTGHDFIYPDDYADSLRNYLALTGQVDAAGRAFSTNTEADGRFHSNWLNMMYPRLYLARNLLADNGIVVVSIDDGEAANLRLLCDQVFGAENLVAQLPWKSRESVAGDTDLSVQHEYLVAYAKVRRKEHRRLKETNRDVWHRLPSFAAYPAPVDPSRYTNPDNDPRGPWKADPFDAPNIRPNLTYEIVNPNTGERRMPPKGRCWRTEEPKYHELLADKRIVFGSSGNAGPQLKVFYREKREYGEVPTSWFDAATYGTATKGTQQLQDLFGDGSPFSFPKPVELLTGLLQLCTRPGDIVLDFFAGSGTTAHAVLAHNRADGGSRKFVLVQLPEPTGRDDYPTIADITKERVRRVIQRLTPEASAPQGSLFEAAPAPADLGFRVFKLDQSNFTTWDADASHDADGLAQQLSLHVDHIREGRGEQDLLFEILLKEGFPLTAPVETLTVAGKVVYSVADGGLLLCLERELTLELIRAIAERQPERVVCLDAGFAGNDQLKTNAVQIFRSQGVVKFKTV
ncbi:MAG: site-specific DNA-methyltransferase [Fimbriimonadaceae bacterium]|nr:site-specific DNA-methyltransferase [Fimbriimonadaceae bacterium]